MDGPLAPRCYVLDEGYRLVFASAPSPDDPLNHLYAADSSADTLPQDVDRLVRVLTRHWDRFEVPQEASGMVRGLRITVAPLHGGGGRHIAVFVARDAIDPPNAFMPYAQSA
jgi:hypothetical protein